LEPLTAHFSLNGCGESFTSLDKRGQKINLWTKDAHGVETKDMYKPVPFYMSSRGYGVFIHTSAPVTLDFGQAYHEASTVFSADPILDLFLFTGDYREILEAYTGITGHAEVPPYGPLVYG
jgi:alpha-D-xyloside xylohydrolase